MDNSSPKSPMDYLVEMLDGGEYTQCPDDAVKEYARMHRLVIVHGRSDDLMEFDGAISDEAYAYTGTYASDPVRITRAGVPESRCEDGYDCPHYQDWVASGLKSGEIHQIDAFWCGQKMSDGMKQLWEYHGKPNWFYGAIFPHRTFRIYETDGDEKRLYCLGIVFDLDEVFGEETP